MAMLRRKQRYVRRFRRRLAGLDVRLDIRIEARLVVADLEPLQPIKPPPKPEIRPKPDDLAIVLARRDAWLARKGIRVVRIGRKEVLDISGVMQAIDKDITATMLARIASIFFWFRVQQQIGRPL